ncbi:achaete-scute homolog 2-like [Oppia nitens]|uniref:achaete-scute homolog 2-like n=1 Tax=Oppia nitens TaxID=1686743 RepID=UPI0023D9B845|nr:achaete-scute homolog 2-like [Oppia nitens]
MDLTVRKPSAQVSVKRPVGRPKKEMDIESRVRREIANHRERQRVKSINIGIQALRQMLRSDDSNTISKSAVLFRCADYILTLEKQLAKHVEENVLLKIISAQHYETQTDK